jgi:dipeptidyl aminopeptidase/acylaminoacyl peptidase
MPQPFAINDLLLHQRVLDVHLSPDGLRAVCTVQTADAAADGNVSSLWCLWTDGSRPSRRFTAAEGARDSSPRWSPNGSQLAFVSTRDGGLEQLFLMPADGGEAQRLTHLPNGLMDFAWHPDGTRLLAIASIDVNPDDRGGRPQGPVQRDANAPQLAWRLPYKQNGAGYQLDREFHLFVVDATTGEHRQLTDGPFDVTSAAWSPDGREIAYARRREGRTAHQSDIWCLALDGGAPERLTHDQPTATSPSWSPDGRHIVFAGNVEEGDAQSRWWCIERASGRVVALGHEDVEIVATTGPLPWSADGSELAFVLARHGLQEVATFSVPQGRLQRRVTGERHVTALHGVGDRLVLCTVSATELDTVRTCGWDGRGERAISGFNAWWSERTPLQAEYRHFTVPDGDGGQETVCGWVVRAKGVHGPQPLLVDAHGGPAAYMELALPSHGYWPVLCSQGWTVLALNPVGSATFGREFTSRLRARWGELDLPQQLAAVDALVAAGLADAGRLAITGKSYGGYLSAYAIGNTDRFKAAVVCAPVGNLETHYGTSDGGYYADPYSMCGTPQLNRDASVRLSPMRHVEKTRTPTLFLHGELDERCPKCQSEELFVTLMAATDTPAELVLYPGGDHHVFQDGRPSHRLDAVRRTVDWLTHWA